MRGSFVAVLGFLVALSGCPPERRVCGATNEPPIVVDEPSVGLHRGTITWLQTGESTDLTVDVQSEALTRELSPCHPVDDRPITVATYSLQSGDGAISLDVRANERVASSGKFLDRTVTLQLDARALLEAGVAPEQPGLAQRSPKATLTLERPEDLSTGVISATTDQDQLTLGLVEFEAR
ncbi:MAG TPA: hypothetical protein VM686_24865 [Polyangiaceae bacterium]|nr:hypothetical protein [Polyangiaceae bacterium]